VILGDDNFTGPQEDLMPKTRLRRHATVAATALAAATSWAIATQLVHVHLGVQFPHAKPSTVGLVPVSIAAATAAVLGWGVLALLETRASRPRRTWALAALAALVASLALPLSFATSTSAALGLVAVHLAVAAVAITGLASTAPACRLRTSPAAEVGGSSPLGSSTLGSSTLGSSTLGSSHITAAGPEAGQAQPNLWKKLARAPKLAVAAAVVVALTTGAAAVAAAGTLAASGIRPPWAPWGAPTSILQARSASDGPWAGRPTFGAWASSPTGAWGSGAAGGAHAGTGAKTWPAQAPNDTEHFYVYSTRQAGPGTITLSGVLNERGVEQPGRYIDRASFANGSFRINHSAGRPTSRFDRATCAGTITQAGPFYVFDATGRFRALMWNGLSSMPRNFLPRAFWARWDR